RLQYGLHPWRHRGVPGQLMLRSKTVSIWSETWQTPEEWLSQLQSRLRAEGSVGFAGGGYDDWDLEIQGGMLAAARTRLAIEEHGAGRQMLRFKIWPRCSASGFSMLVLISCICVAAGYDQSWTAATLLFAIGLTLGGRMLYECALAMHKLTNVLEDFSANIAETKDTSDAKPVALRAVARNSSS